MSFRRLAIQSKNSLGALVIAAVVFSSLVIAPRLSAQSVSVYPHLIVIDARTHTASVTLANSGDVATEVTLSTFYGYPATDAQGTMFLQVPDTGTASSAAFHTTSNTHTSSTLSDTMRSAAGWIQILPERILLPPHGNRTVRLLVDAPNATADGEYWARLGVTMQGGELPVQGNAPGIQSKLALKIRTVFPIVYRTGALSTGARLAQPRTSIVGDSLVTRTLVTRTGNAAYLGALAFTLRDASGHVVAQQNLPVSVYFTMDPRLALPIHGLHAGTYTLTTALQSSRPDIPASQLLHASSTETSVRVTIP